MPNTVDGHIPTPAEISYCLTRNYEAMQSVVASLKILKEHSGSWRETLLINLMLALYEHRLEIAVHDMRPESNEQIMKEKEPKS